MRAVPTSGNALHLRGYPKLPVWWAALPEEPLGAKVPFQACALPNGGEQMRPSKQTQQTP